MFILINIATQYIKWLAKFVSVSFGCYCLHASMAIYEILITTKTGVVLMAAAMRGDWTVRRVSSTTSLGGATAVRDSGEK